MSSKCNRCEILPEIPSEPARMFIVSVHELMLSKIRDFFQSREVKFLDLGEGLLAEVQNPRELLRKLFSEVQFSVPELEDTSLVFLKPDETPSFKHFKNMKTLLAWREILEAEDYLEILAEGRLTVHFQAVATPDLKIAGYECLIRGVKRDGTLVSPGVLFKMAERTDTLFFLDRACREVAIKTSAVKKLYDCLVFINFVPTSIYDPRFCLQNTIKWAYQLEFDPKNVVFEVVESHRVEDIKHLGNILSFYKDNGFHVALDDVGTGYASLDMLVKLRPDIVKIDMEIVRNIHNDPLKQSILKAISQICRENNIIIHAEGIETPEEFEYLKDKVDLMQGFCLSRPNPEPVREVTLTICSQN